MFKKVLIANRGEITVRITKTLQEMGIKTVSIFSDTDKIAPHVTIADEAYPLNGVSPSETYLNIEKIIQIAKESNIDAIHPGYGFLSENAVFAQACQDAGIKFIGPSPKVIEAMGDKIIAKKTMKDAGVPIIPGWTGDTIDFGEIKKAAGSIGYPVLVKAAAGGGGKGMRLVNSSSELEAAIESASREAKKAFGDGRIFLEKYITNPRHIEFQIFGDNHGNIIHLFERECSIQRRHQKIIEESPSSVLTPDLREKMGEAAIKAAKAIGYTNAGTVEFIVDKNKKFYFLEVNTRLQVEHPVTESVIHGDLVKAQVLIASGEKLHLSQKDLKQDGHAIECRVYAEDPENNFFPSTGTLYVYKEPTGPGIRVDSGVIEGTEISVHYDPMLAKVIAWAKTRDSAIEKMLWALSNYPVLGIKTNISFLHDLISHESFRCGDIDTHFLERFPINEIIKNKEEPMSILISSLLLNDRKRKSIEKKLVQPVNEMIQADPWVMGGNWKII